MWSSRFLRCRSSTHTVPRRHDNKGLLLAHQRPACTSTITMASSERAAEISVLSYNLWFDRSVAFADRMRGFMDLVSTLQPDVLMLQEVTRDMASVWQLHNPHFFEQYKLSQPPRDERYYTLLGWRTARMQQLMVDPVRVPFPNSEQGRDVTCICLKPKLPSSAPPLLVATSHLESPVGDEILRVRRDQVLQGVSVLMSEADTNQVMMPYQGGREARGYRRRGKGPPEVDIVWGGDMNWLPEHQEEPPLPQEWQDVWVSHYPRDPGYTYDTESNPMLRGVPYKPGRLDRFFARLGTWQVVSIQVVGKEPLHGVTTNAYGREKQVLISDHYGLFLKLQS